MKLVWHIFRKDLRRLAWPLAGWGAVIVAQYLVWRSFHRWPEREGAVEVIWSLWGLHLLAGWLLVPALIHEDSLVGSLAAWRTRPISGARLLAAKLLGLLVMFAVWPSLLTLPWWVGFGFGPAEILRAMAINACGMVLFVSLGAAVAVLTEDFARFVAWSLVLGVTVVAGVMVLFAAAGTEVVSVSILFTRASFVGRLGVVTAVLIVALQFLRRDLRWARGLGAAALLVGLAVIQGWPWSVATLLDKTGLKSLELPSTHTRLARGLLAMPHDEAKRPGWVQPTFVLATTGLAAGELVRWDQVELTWKVGENRRREAPTGLWQREDWERAAQALVASEGSISGVQDWETGLSDMPEKLIGPLKNGDGSVRAQYHGTLWRGEKGPTAPLLAGASGAKGLEQLHVTEVSGHFIEEAEGVNLVRWLQTEPFFTPGAILGLFSPERKSPWRNMVLFTGNGQSHLISELKQRGELLSTFPQLAIPVGMIGVMPLEETFSVDLRRRDGEPENYFPLNSGSLTCVSFQEVAPLEVETAEAAFHPQIVVESRLDEALRRAKAEHKLVLAIVRESRAGVLNGLPPIAESHGPVSDLIRLRFVCVQLFEESHPRFARPYPGENFPQMVVLTPENIVQDRFSFSGDGSVLKALTANLAGGTYVDTLRAELAAGERDERAARELRRRLASAYLVRDEIAEALAQVHWLAVHQPMEVGWQRLFWWRGFRLEDSLVGYGPANTMLRSWRDQALADLKRDPRDPSAVWALFAAGFYLMDDAELWRSLPDAVSRENPFWWQFTSEWFWRSVMRNRYRDAVEAVNVEQLFAAGRDWAREEFARVRAVGTLPRPLDYIHRYVFAVGIHGVRALIGVGEIDRAKKLVGEILKFDGSREARSALARELREAGAGQVELELFGKNSPSVEDEIAP